jgi:hypothetical protein
MGVPTRARLLLAMLGAAASAGSGLAVETFTNSGLSGTPSFTSTVPDTTLISADGISAFVYGTVTFPSAGTWSFDCAFSNTAVGFFWVDGHLICKTVIHTALPFRMLNTSVEIIDDPLPIRR